MVIYQDGSASPCEILHTIHPDQSATFGNLKDYDFNCQSLLKAKEAQDRIKWIKIINAFVHLNVQNQMMWLLTQN